MALSTLDPQTALIILDLRKGIAPLPLAIDAMTDASMDSHTCSLTKIFPRLGESGTTREVLNLLNSTPV